MEPKEKKTGRDYPLATTPPVKANNALDELKKKIQKTNTLYMTTPSVSSKKKDLKFKLDLLEKQYDQLKGTK
jgi:hypothetical protein